MGNNGPTDGWFYPGRGLIQITGLTNYRDCGNALKVDLVAQPELLAQDAYAARSAAWFYASRGCLKYTGDLVRVTQIINGGQNGVDDRRARYLTAKRRCYDSRHPESILATACRGRRRCCWWSLLSLPGTCTAITGTTPG
jgi:predicted chitinase